MGPFLRGVCVMLSVDWLTVFQFHDEAVLPVVGATWRVETAIETGETVSKMVTGMEFAGSYETALRVRCDGCRVEVSGNPSAFDRLDNVFGVPSVAAGLDVFNRVLLSLGLPPFEETEVTHLALRQFAHSDTVMGAGPKITRVDICENWACGDASLALRCLSGYVHHGKRGHLYGNGKTVDWGGGQRVYTKYYEKGEDVDTKRQEVEKAIRKCQSAEDEGPLKLRLSYLDRLSAWCASVGVVRHEVSLKRRQLYRLGLQRPGAWGVVDMGEVIESYRFHKRLNVESGELLNVAERLQVEGVKEREARRAELAFRAWYTGADLRVEMPKTTFYRVRKLLLLCGVDVGSPCDIAVLPVRVQRVEFKELAVPTWYGQAA